VLERGLDIISRPPPDRNVFTALMGLEQRICELSHLALIVREWMDDQNFCAPGLDEDTAREWSDRADRVAFAVSQIADRADELRTAFRAALSRRKARGEPMPLDAGEATMTAQQPRPFDPQKLLWDAILAEKAKLLAELPQAVEPQAFQIRQDIAACESLLAKFARARAVAGDRSLGKTNPTSPSYL
jgi:hypothetical protein